MVGEEDTYVVGEFRNYEDLGAPGMRFMSPYFPSKEYPNGIGDSPAYIAVNIPHDEAAKLCRDVSVKTIVWTCVVKSIKTDDFKGQFSIFAYLCQSMAKMPEFREEYRHLALALKSEAMFDVLMTS